ncbi:hypothetical protein BGZ46_005092 [Entomortierella lignicola]|nr:hypothetical protein BGZ46_005092 [Entomortierella lignicola]
MYGIPTFLSGQKTSPTAGSSSIDSLGGSALGESTSIPNLISQQPIRKPSMTSSQATITTTAHIDATSLNLSTSTSIVEDKLTSNSAAAQLLSRVSEELKQRPWRPLPDKRIQVSYKLDSEDM